MQHVLRTANLGFPSIGADRELKFAIENYWRKTISAQELHEKTASLRRTHWTLQHQLGLTYIPSHDFTLYDRMLDMSILLGAIPARFHVITDPLERYFAMARGVGDIVPLEMTKWFSTNYHYVVPELEAQQRFALGNNTVVAAYKEALSVGLTTRPVIIGPLSFLLLSNVDGGANLQLLPALTSVYEQLLLDSVAAGITHFQIDEPCLTLDLTVEQKNAYQQVFAALHTAAPTLHLCVTTYFGELADALQTACSLPVQALHVDFVHAEHELAKILDVLPATMELSCGIVDGHNVWATEMPHAARLVQTAVDRLGEHRVILAPSCSLLHVPWEARRESTLPAEVQRSLAFGHEKLLELVSLANASLRHEALTKPARAINTVNHEKFTTLMQNPPEREPRQRRQAAQAAYLQLPLFPTTTIGSLPQTADIRALRLAYKTGKLTNAEYEQTLRERTAEAIAWQEKIGLDVLVHGEFERNDMVEYFGERLKGFITTKHGWVQSYGTRCVKPPIIHGDVERTAPMTLEMSCYAQSLTNKPMKGMLTGPITILQWSFVRNDQPRSITALQIALALQAEVQDLCAAGFAVVQIDEPALREGLPLRKSDWAEYLQWAIAAFKVAAAGAPAETQIHTHMCYADFEDIMDAITALDVDVISLESARSKMRMLSTLKNAAVEYAVGPGVYDIHSPNIPTLEEVTERIAQLRQALPDAQIWINPDCGLKTRTWNECFAALTVMVQATQAERTALQALLT